MIVSAQAAYLVAVALIVAAFGLLISALRDRSEVALAQREREDRIRISKAMVADRHVQTHLLKYRAKLKPSRRSNRMWPVC